MDTFSQLAQSIIEEQQSIIGPLALEQARKVPGLIINDSGKEIKFNGNQTDIVEKLVEKYRDLFGKASVQVCRNAAKSYLSKIPQDKIPSILA